MKTTNRWIAILFLLLPPLAGLADSTNFSSLSAPHAPATKWLGSGGSPWSVSESYRTGWSFFLPITPFEPSWGTLLSIDWQITSLGVRSSSYSYYGPQGAGAGSASESWQLTARMASSTSARDPGYFELNGGLGSASGGTSIPVGGSGTVNVNLNHVGGGSILDPDILSYFFSNDTTHYHSPQFYSEGQLDSRYQYAQGGGGETVQVGFAITYNFTPTVVPEPGPLTLAVLGLGIFGGSRLRTSPSAAKRRC